MILKTTNYNSHQWKSATDESIVARDLVKTSSENFPKISEFAVDVFSFMHDKNDEVEKNITEDKKPYEKLFHGFKDLPEIEDLRNCAFNNEELSATATVNILQSLVDNSNCKFLETEDEKQALEACLQLQESINEDVDEDEKEFYKDMIAEFQQSIFEKTESNSQAIDSMEMPTIRNAIRKIAKKTTAEFNEHEKFIETMISFSRNENHSGAFQGKSCRKKLSKILASNTKIKAIAEMAGRLKRIAEEKQASKPKIGTNERSGIETGSDFGKMVPSEMVYMDEMEMLIVKKFTEKSLFVFETSDIPLEKKGPLIVCVDSSGSMIINRADLWSSAVALAFLQIAKNQKRDFYLIHFGDKVLRETEISKSSEIDIEKLVENFTFFASSGSTDFRPPLNRSFEIIRDNIKFKKADVIFVTDGCDSIDESFSLNLLQHKSNFDFKIYSILVGCENSFSLEKISDGIFKVSNCISDESQMHEVFSKI